MYAVKDKKVIDKAETNVVVEQVGIVKNIIRHGTRPCSMVYGLMSIFGALIAGFVVAVVFPKKGKGGH